ncbi:MAG TPA: ATP-binding domain-containing protein, partial [Aggregatilineales bacterium]|nr:ATP-binding domain-containing protein [Aggregatilineales bacterium]
FSLTDGFVHNSENTINTDFVVIDEASMLDLHLFYALARAIAPDTHLLLVGDVDQLPSVGAGDVLRDLIRSHVCDVTRLRTIFRQEKGSLIIENAHRVNQGEMPDLNNEGQDFFFFGKEDPVEAAELLADIVQNRIPQKFGFHPVKDVQVLAPMYRTPIGVTALNEALQAKLNPPGRHAEQLIGGQILRVGDKVMQTRNNYDKSVFNGDTGIVRSIDFEKRELELVIDAEYHRYSWIDAADQITLAYACSVHRSQGSEYPVIVIPVLTQHYMMLQRNLLYTAITRARQLVVLVGTRKAIGIAVRNNKVSRRWSALDWRLQSSIF